MQCSRNPAHVCVCVRCPRKFRRGCTRLQGAALAWWVRCEKHWLIPKLRIINFFSLENSDLFSRTARKKGIQKLFRHWQKGGWRVRGSILVLSAFTDAEISINIPCCSLSVTFLESCIFLQEEVVGCDAVLCIPFSTGRGCVTAITAGKEGAGVPGTPWLMGGGWRENKGFLCMISTFYHT